MPASEITQDGAVVYTDGSCLGNPGPGGWAVHAEFSDGRVVELGGGELETTNNRMELRAAIEAARLTLGCSAVTVITDSHYVRSGVTKWLDAWKRNGWRTADNRPVENQALWRELDALNDARITWQWTRAHVGTPGNERCDQIARWFAAGIRGLDATHAAPSSAPALTKRPASSSGQAYLSLVDGIIARHRTWEECKNRVHGVRGAKFRKVRNAEEERATVSAWGMPPDALEYL